MKRMGSDNDKGRHGVWNESERYCDNQIQGLKSVKRQKTPSKSFVWADELKRQLTYTLKPSKCSNTDISKVAPKAGNGGKSELKAASESDLETEKTKPQQKKFFADSSLEKIFSNSDYFKLKSGNGNSSMSFCSGENGENRWTIEANAPGRKAVAMSTEKSKESMLSTSEDAGKLKKSNVIKKSESMLQAEELKILRENVDLIIQEMKLLNRDFGLVRTDLKSIEKLLRLQKQVSKSKSDKKEESSDEVDKMNTKLGKFSEDVEKAAQELRDFIDNNRTLLIGSKDVPDSPDFDKIMNNLQRLSETAYQPKIIQTSKGAKFEVPREIPITLFADGIMLRNTDFRKYTDIKAGLFLRDIEDGFFPTELWPEYPCGVPFQVTDKRCEMYNDGNIEIVNSFPGSGRRLGSTFDGKPSSMIYLQPTKHHELEKKKSNGFSSQEQYKHRAIRPKTASNHNQLVTEDRIHEFFKEVTHSKPISLKVRLGSNGEDHLSLVIMSDERMSQFQDALFKKLCEKYHEEYVKKFDSSDFDNSKYGDIVPDFEIHVYGRKPFRLSENLTSYPSDCGIVDNCVINITEI